MSGYWLLVVVVVVGCGGSVGVGGSGEVNSASVWRPNDWTEFVFDDDWMEEEEKINDPSPETDFGQQQRRRQQRKKQWTTTAEL